ncbi:MAG: glycosyltransferase family A protein, partial [Burkholderiales bacterium]
MVNPLISVIICTHNRACLLRGAIESVTSQDYDADGYEIIVVDNASTDHTREVVESFSETANVRYVYESRLGLNSARNTGWRSASGIFAVFLDDDARAQPGWLAAIRDGFAATGGQAVIGGKVDPIWESEQPEWLSNKL